MAESMKGLKRSYRCGEITTANIGETVTVMGWVQKQRNKGGIIFVDLRDRSGLLQIVFEEGVCGSEAFAKAEPKWYMGYSDNTNMTYLLTTLADTASIYGPCAATFGMRKWHKAIQDSFDVLSGKMTTVSGYDMWELEGFDSELDPIAEYNLTEKKILRRFK